MGVMATLCWFCRGIMTEDWANVLGKANTFFQDQLPCTSFKGLCLPVKLCWTYSMMGKRTPRFMQHFPTGKMPSEVKTRWRNMCPTLTRLSWKLDLTWSQWKLLPIPKYMWWHICLQCSDNFTVTFTYEATAEMNRRKTMPSKFPYLGFACKNVNL